MSSNPKHIGPGYWSLFHSTSLVANTRDKKASIAKIIVMAIDVFPCRDPCRKDAIKYIKENPLLPVVDNKDDLSLFKWTINFHNYVNIKLGKSIWTWEDAKNAWSGKEGICFEDCGLSESEIDRQNEGEFDIVIKSY
jgi:hypothetical protein